MNLQNIPKIGSVLGVEFVEKIGNYSAFIVNAELGTKTRVEVRPAENYVRVFVDRNRGKRPTFISRFDLAGVQALRFEEGQALFVSERFVLVVNATGSAWMTNADDNPTLPVEGAEELIELTGVIGRPEFRKVKDGTLSLWTAGLGVPRADGGKTDWMNLIAWRAVADRADRDFASGEQVRVKGAFRQEEYRDRHGQERVKDVLVVQEIVAA